MGNRVSKASIILILLVLVGLGVGGFATASSSQQPRAAVSQRTSGPLDRLDRWWRVFSTNLVQDLFRNRFVW
jgi:hypothetical protein